MKRYALMRPLRTCVHLCMRLGISITAGRSQREPALHSCKPCIRYDIARYLILHPPAADTVCGHMTDMPAEKNLDSIGLVSKLVMNVGSKYHVACQFLFSQPYSRRIPNDLGPRAFLSRNYISVNRARTEKQIEWKNQMPHKSL